MLYLIKKELIILFSLLCILSLSQMVSSEEITDQVVSDAIRNKIESNLFTFSPKIQRHYSERMYRITGDEKYIFAILGDLLITVDELNQDLENINCSKYIDKKGKFLLNEFNNKSIKMRQRREFFENRTGQLFQLRILYNTNKIASYGLDKSDYKKLCERSITYLKGIDFKNVLLDTTLIRLYSPQAVNYVFYLKNLGIVDFREEYQNEFRNLYNELNDSFLVKWEYKNKIYGLTHFILAASNYYQKDVSNKKYKWILNYFRKNIKKILENTTVDIIAEVGICFLLTSNDNDDIVKLCKNHVISKFDQKNSIIPSPKGDADISRGEHRNVLVYMLLNWPKKLRKGPLVDNYKKYKELFQYIDYNEK